MAKNAKARDPKHNFKNKEKDGQGKGWCTEDLYFDEDGCLYVANEELASAIEASLKAWGNRLTMYRRRRDDEVRSVRSKRAAEGMEKIGYATPPTRSMAESQAKIDGTAKPMMLAAAPGPETEDDESEPKMNMMCPCAPEP